MPPKISDPRRIVSDTGPLISAERITGGFRLLRLLYDQIIIPPEVLAELLFYLPPGTDYLEHYDIQDLIRIEPSPAPPPGTDHLHAAEKCALALAIKHKLPLLVEERDARQEAKNQQVRIIGMAGLIIKARNIEIISSAEARALTVELYQRLRINKYLYTCLLGQFTR